MNTVSCSLPMPDNFRPVDILTFHHRDVLAVAETVDVNTLHKGLLWNRSPACLTIRFDASLAQVELAIDGPATIYDTAALRNLSQRMLGLNQPIEEFEQRYRRHP